MGPRDSIDRCAIDDALDLDWTAYRVRSGAASDATVKRLPAGVTGARER